MQIELRKIDGQDFMVCRSGRKEFVRTPHETIDIARRNLVDSVAALADCQEAVAQIDRQIETALLAGESTVALRTDLVLKQETEQGLMREVAEHEESIRQVFRLIDDHTANEIRAAAAARLAAMLTPYDNTLKELTQ
jgi:hypothetical protein